MLSPEEISQLKTQEEKQTIGATAVLGEALPNLKIQARAMEAIVEIILTRAVILEANKSEARQVLIQPLIPHNHLAMTISTMTPATALTPTVVVQTVAVGNINNMKKLTHHSREGGNPINRSSLRNKFLPVLAVLILSLSLISYLISPINTTAQQSPLSIQFSPNNAQLKTGEEQIITIKLESTEKISAVDLKFQTSGSLEITDFRDFLTTDNNLNPFEYKLVKENPSGASYIFTTSNLPTSVTVYLKIKGSVTGEGKITIDYNNSQVINGTGNLLRIDPNQSAVYNLNQTQSSSDFINESSLPPINYPNDTAQINLKLKLFGALPNGVTNLKGTVVAVGRNGETKYETQPQQINLSQNSDGTFSGRVAFPDFRDGTNFSLMVKVDKYLLRRICDTTPSEQEPSEYICTDPSLTIRQGQNNFDFSGISLLPGDLGLIDGLLNGYDLSIVRNNISQNSKESISSADLNYDGIVDLKDFEIITKVADNTNRKADN